MPVNGGPRQARMRREPFGHSWQPTLLVNELYLEFEAGFPSPKWSPDGSRIVFTGTAANGRSQLIAADTATHSAVPLTNDALDYAGATWSHDGKYLFAGAEENSVYGIYRLPASGGGAQRFSPDSGTSPREREST